MSRVKFGEIVTGVCHGLLWPLKVSRVKRCVTGMFFGNCHGYEKDVTGFFFENCHGLDNLCHGLLFMKFSTLEKQPPRGSFLFT